MFPKCGKRNENSGASVIRRFIFGICVMSSASVSTAGADTGFCEGRGGRYFTEVRSADQSA